jgi:hypothetical protein
MKWTETDLEDHRIITGEGFFDDLDDVPPTTGVFLFVNDAMEVKYVGAAPDGHLQNVATKAYESGKGNGATKVGWARTFSYSKALALAQDWKHKYNPANN